DGSDELSFSRELEADEAPFGERAADDRLRRRLRVAEHLELLVEELREEHGELVVRGPRAGELASQVTALRVRARPVLDPAETPGRGVGIARNVADRVDVRERRAEALVDDDSVVDLRAGVLGELDVGHDPDADDRQVALDRRAVLRAG